MESLSNDIIVNGDHSHPDVHVLDRLSIDVSTFKVNKHRGAGKERVEAYVWIYAGGVNEPWVLWGPKQLSFNQRVYQGHVHTFNESLELDIKRAPGACFGLSFWSAEGVKSADANMQYCWDEFAATWKRSDNGKSFGESDSKSVSDGSRFKVTLNWALKWHSTTMEGTLNERLNGDQADGLEWHHLRPIFWAGTNDNIRVEMTPGNQGDPDLYVSYSGRPSYNRFDCRPYSGGSTPEVCEAVNQDLYVSVRNYSSSVESPYSVTISKDIGNWSAWLNRDGPSGGGDGEWLSEFSEAQVGCASPKSIRCRRISDRAYWAFTVPYGAPSDAYRCHYALGGICLNDKMPGGCDDYEVQFLCD